MGTNVLVDGKSIARIKMPYMANWTAATMTNNALGNASHRIHPVVLHFAHQGTLLRMRFKSLLNHDIQLQTIKVETNAFVDRWRYSFPDLKKSTGLMSGEGVTALAFPLGLQNYEWTTSEVIVPHRVSETQSGVSESWLYA